jgi:hypothetical protein
MPLNDIQHQALQLLLSDHLSLVQTLLTSINQDTLIPQHLDDIINSQDLELSNLPYRDFLKSQAGIDTAQALQEFALIKALIKVDTTRYSVGKTQLLTNTSLEERLAAVEAAVVNLQNQSAIPQPTNWLQQITGSFKDEPAFDEVLAYGQAIRQGDEAILEAQDEP